MEEKIQEVVIVGGGTAGWLSALFLKKHLGKEANITLIESPNIPTIGAGEATIPGIISFIEALGIDEEDFLISCNATFKFGIEYTHWTNPNEKNPIWHPFYSTKKLSPSIADLYFYKEKMGLTEENIASFWNPDMPFILENKAPRDFTESPYYWNIPYAYHFDSHLLAKFLTNLGEKKGIKHISDTVIDVQMQDKENIHSVHTRSNGSFKADLFIDCSGFKRIMIKEKLNSPYVSVQDKILCDRALALKLPYKNKSEEMTPYTTVKGMKSGWMWRIPLQEEIGYGYVHSSRHSSKEEATEEMSQHLGFSPEKYPLNHIFMENGYLEKPWIGNCIAIGLSAGFIEPLESTGLYFITYTLDTLLKYFPCKGNFKHQAKPYNLELQNLTKSVLTFIYLHYHLNSRDDTPFWQDNKNNPVKDPDLEAVYQNYLENYGKPLILSTFKKSSVFTGPSYIFFLHGLGIKPKEFPPIAKHPNFNRIAELEHQQSILQSKQLEKLPTMEVFLKHLKEKKMSSNLKT
ncbi:Flavin-dependent tryptophan halogenase RebH [Chlamydiales bacterium SCGC AB-751-O23]|jgi:flavin-dependent dehydrogenase|nr:Flavin-dependent tryptophan halogenase RebH [Chlamydiales bacterium SCGC AB-751-O23]